MPDKLHLQFFGSPQFTHQGKPVTGFVSNKARALLIYLAVTGSAHSREALAELLWADTPASKRVNLKRALSNLRNLAGVVLVEAGQQSVALDPAKCWVDVAEFEQFVAAATQSDAVDDLHHVAQWYQGDFLAGFPLSLSYEFEAWALGEQTRLRAQLVEVLRRLADAYAQRNEFPHAIATVRRLLQLEPWREAAHRQLMELLARSGDRSGALAHFAICRQQLQAELAVDPSAATLELIANLRADAFSSPPARPVVTTPTPGVTRPLVQQVMAPRQIGQQTMTTTVEYPLVGRAHEWQVIQAIWQALARPHFITIGGEAGIGKTRLAEELMILAEREGAPIAHTRSHALQGQLAYGPVTDWLRSPPLQAALAQLDAVWLTELALLLPELRADRPDLAPPKPLRESWQRKRLFDALRHAFAAIEGPLLLVLDDLQWSDVDTVEWLQYLVESGERRLLVVGTVRTDEIAADHPLHYMRQQLQRHGRVTELALAPLDPAATTALAAKVMTQVLTGERAERLFDDTAGNPLFIIESMRTIATQGADSLVSHNADQRTGRDQVVMPPKMYSVIQARLAQLSPEAQTLAQLGATIGRAFDLPFLAMAAERTEESVLAGLDELWQRRIIREVNATHFDFSHDRIRDVAYAEISPIRRRLLHRQVANALATIHDKNLDAVAGQLAVHFEAAGLLEEAITFYQRAADSARQLFANQEAVNYRQQALATLHQLPRNRENRQAEIDLLFALVKDQTRAHGLGSPAVYQDLQAAYALAQEFGTPVQRARVLNELAGYARVRGEWMRAHELGNAVLTAAIEVNDPLLLAHARFGIASSLMRRGKLEDAHVQFVQIQPIFSEILPHSNIGYLTRFAYCLWLLGFPEQAVQQAAKALEWRRKYEQHALPVPLHHYSSIALFCGDLATVERLSAELVELTTQRHDDFFLRWGMIYRGWLLVQQGHLDDGIKVMRENADEHRARENYFYECFWRSLLAEAYLLTFDLDAALQEIDSTLAYAQESGDHHLDAQLLKLRGDCLQAANAPVSKIERHYQLAINTARQQKGRSLELRATTSLCRLWQKQGKIDEAYQLLAAIYGCFTEGFATGDLVAAKKLLAALQGTLPPQCD